MINEVLALFIKITITYTKLANNFSKIPSFPEEYKRALLSFTISLVNFLMVHSDHTLGYESTDTPRITHVPVSDTCRTVVSNTDTTPTHIITLNYVIFSN